MFKLEVLQKPEKAKRRYEAMVKEVSLLSSLVLGVAVLIFFCILLICSLYRQRQPEKNEIELKDHQDAYGDMNDFS